MRIIKHLSLSLLVLTTCLSAMAADPLGANVVSNGGSASWHPTTIVGALVATLAFGLVGIALAIVGFKVFDAATKFDLEKEICENKNMAAAVLCAAMLLGICIIVAAAIVG